MGKLKGRKAQKEHLFILRFKVSLRKGKIDLRGNEQRTTGKPWSLGHPCNGEEGDAPVW